MCRLTAAHTHADAEPTKPKRSGAGDGTAAALQAIKKGHADTGRDRLAKAAASASQNADGTATKPKTPTIMGEKTPVSLTGGSPLLPGADRSRTPAKAPASALPESPFVPIAQTPIGWFRPHEIEHLANHGVSVGIVNGIMSIKREYLPSATGLISLARGGR